jgi:hypothetical protein
MHGSQLAPQVTLVGTVDVNFTNHKICCKICLIQILGPCCTQISTKVTLCCHDYLHTRMKSASVSIISQQRQNIIQLQLHSHKKQRAVSWAAVLLLPILLSSELGA